MNSIGKDCNELKAKYDECFHVWFSEKFLKGDTKEDMCQPIFSVYKNCVRVSNSSRKILVYHFKPFVLCRRPWKKTRST